MQQFTEFTGKQYLQIDIANNFGLDKALWSERLAWFAQHESALEVMIPKAEEPALFYAAVKAWRDVQQGIPTGYAISLDATSSGLQILAALTGDRKAGELCNVVNVGHRADAYTGIYQAMLKTIGGDAKIKREDTKQAIMTALYGSKAMPKKVFGEGEMLRIFEETMAENAPAAWELNEAFLDMWDSSALTNDWVLPDNFHVHVKVMASVTETVNFLNEPFDVVRQVNMPMEKGRSLGANTIHSIDGMIVREMARRCNYDPQQVNYVQGVLASGYAGSAQAKDVSNESGRMVKQLWDHYKASGYLSARILDYLHNHNVGHVDDAHVVQELINSLPAKPFQVISVHDCFRCLPSYGNNLRRQYNRQLYEIAKSDLLSFLIAQILGRPVKLGKLDPTLADDILESDYALS